MKFTPFPKIKTKRAVYLDHAAATPMDPAVFEAMKPFLMGEYGNPGGLYVVARRAKEAVDHARERVARIFGTQPRNIIFTGSGTESDNLAIFGVARQYAERGKHIITMSIEHHAVLHSVEALTKEGYEVTQLPVDEDGRVTAEQVRAALREDTILVTVMYANNEIGTIEPIADIGRAIMHWKQKHGRKPTDPPFFHTDACQAAGYLELNVEKLHVDLMTINGSKIYGPKGTGVLYKRDTVRVKPLIYGGGQEMRFRGGTENVAGIVGLATALERAQFAKEKESKRRDVFWRSSEEI
ncbi:MAG: cysteine desulfurase family protein, partial [Patescibacteria group bacterium]